MLKPMSEAPRDRTPVLARFRDDLVTIRADLDRLHGLWVVVRYDGFDDHHSWGLAGPFGYGGIDAKWFVGWQHLPARQ